MSASTKFDLPKLFLSRKHFNVFRDFSALTHSARHIFVKIMLTNK